MGISSDGQLTFGIPIGEEDERPEFMGEFDDFEEFVQNELGLPEWRGGMTDEENKAHWQRKKEALAAYPVRLEMYCSYDYSMYLLTPNVEGDHMYVRRGYLHSFDKLPEIPPESVEAMKAWCEAHGVEWTEPKWHLSSMYG